MTKECPRQEWQAKAKGMACPRQEWSLKECPFKECPCKPKGLLWNRCLMLALVY